MKKWRLKKHNLQKTLDRNSAPQYASFSERLNFIMRNRLPGTTQAVWIEHVYGHTGANLGMKVLRFRAHEIEEYEE